MSRKILLVEDEVLIAMAEAQMLKKYGYEVLTVHNGEKAIETVDSDPGISLILMDIDLGKGIDGPEAAERILAAHDLPIVFLSSHTESEVVETTEKITSYGYVVKYSGATVLDASIKMAFRLFDAKNEARKHAEDLRESETTVRRKLKAITEPEGDISTLELADIIDVEELQLMMEDAFKATKVGGAILDVSGKILVSTAMEDICGEFHRVHPDTARNCLESDLALAGGVPAGTFKPYRCKNNMWDMVTPLEIGGKHLGNIYVGQFFFAEEDVDYEVFRRQARQHGFDETAYLAALDRVPRLKRETVDRAMAFYSRLARMISSLSYTTIKLSRNMVQHQQAEKALRDSHDLLNATQRIAKVGGWEWNVATDTVTWSEELFNITGLDPNSPPPQFNDDHHRIYTKESWQKLTTVVDNTLKTGEPYEMYAQMIRSDGEIRDVYISGGSSSNNNGSIYRLYGIVEDITDKNQRERQLKESEENLRITLNSIGDAVISTDIDGNIVRMNPVAESLCGWSLDEAKGESLDDVFHIVHADTGETVENPVTKVLETEDTIGLANHTMLISRDGKEYQIADSAAPIRDDNGQTTGVVLVFRDVTEEYRVAEALADRERDMARAQTMAQLGSWQFDLDTGIATGSDQARIIYGVNERDLTIDNVQSLPLPEYRPRLDAALKALVQDGMPYDIEFEIRRPSDNTVRNVHSVAEYDAQHHRIVGTVEDITERRRAERRMEVLVTEKERALAESHHRVVNNMSLVTSLLSLHANAVCDQASSGVLRDAAARVQSMIGLYNRLYRRGADGPASIREFLPPLVDEIVGVLDLRGTLSVGVTADDVRLDPKALQTIGIVVNELMTNSVKHAFADEEAGRIAVAASQNGSGIAIVYQDNGRGVPDAVASGEAGGFGMQLVRAMIGRLGGTIAVESKDGVRVTMEIPCEVLTGLG